jgi:exodeoxyribonuclease V alpha subunit
MENPLYAALNDLFRRLDPQWDEVCAEWLQSLLLANQQGHTCLPVPPRVRQRLCASPLVAAPGGYAPLILDAETGLYFARHWHDEARLAEALRQRAGHAAPVAPSAAMPWLDLLFPVQRPGLDRQKLAAALALRQRLLVISGGPGTGKTTTVIRLLALLAALAERPLVMALAAPTGKAAARLTDSILGAIDRLPVDDALKRLLPDRAQTLHRLLGLRPGGGRPRHHADNTLPLDVLVVDEASMIDLALMARTFDALPPHARVILLGDRDQLAAVEVGAVLSELSQTIGYRRDTLDWLRQLGIDAVELPPADGRETPLADCVVLLTQSHRFAADSGIGLFSRAINENRPDEALALLNADARADLSWRAAWNDDELMARRQPYWHTVQSGAPLDQVQQAFVAFMLLAAERRQVEAVNRHVERQLEAAGRKAPEQLWYPGRPVMISSNDYGVGLFNGDVGFTVARPEGLRVAFPDANGGWRELAPARLPEHDTVYAMTVHKSQGSEFDEVWLALPESDANLVDRALVYTAVTRARRSFRLVGSLDMLRTAIGHQATRHSGLAKRMQTT